MNMKWKLLQGGILLLLCDILTVAEEEGKIVEYIGREGRIKVPPQALRHLAAGTTTRYSSDITTEGPEERVNLPSMECVQTDDCKKFKMPLVCDGGQCTCQPPLCWVYQYIVTGPFTAKNEFTCGQCGVLGSSCNATVKCDAPGKCWSDGYCHCPRGENYYGVCLTTSLAWSNALAYGVLGVVLTIALCILGINCIKKPPCTHSEAWRCQCCPGAVNGRQERRGSCEKSPAFTIQAHYASQELTSPPEDAEEAPPSSFGGAVPRRPRIPSTSSETISSISSANTNMTTLNGSVISDDSSTPTPPPSRPPRLPRTTAPSPLPLPPPPPPYSPSVSQPPSSDLMSSSMAQSPSTSLLPSASTSSSIDSALPQSSSSLPTQALASYPPLPQNSKDVSGGREGDSSDIQLTEGLPEASELRPSTSKSSPEIASEASGTSASCTHERCQLCLPKPPPSPSSAPPPERSSERHNKRGDSPLLPRSESPREETSIELHTL